MYKLSIIIPHYNSVETLDRLLQSIPLWDIRVQVIIVDDKSDAEQIERLNTQFGDKYFNLIILQNDTGKKGAGVCRNIGLKQAEGKWVLFADADDFFVPNFYETLENYFNSNLDVVFFAPTSVEEGSMLPSNRHEQYETLVKDYLKDSTDNNELLLRYKFYVPWSKLYAKDFLLKHQIEFDETWVANDVMFSTKAGYYMTVFEVTEDVIYCWTQKKGTLTNIVNEKAYDTRLAVYVNYCTFLFERLNAEQVKFLNLKGRGHLITGIKHRFDLFKLINIVLLMRKNKIGLFDWKYLNPIFFIRRARRNYGVYKEEKKFYSKG